MSPSDYTLPASAWASPSPIAAWLGAGADKERAQLHPSALPQGQDRVQEAGEHQTMLRGFAGSPVPVPCSQKGAGLLCSAMAICPSCICCSVLGRHDADLCVDGAFPTICPLFC